MRPKLIERFVGYVTDIDTETFFLIAEKQNEQMEIPLDKVRRSIRERMREGTYAYLLIYENRISFRRLNVGRWTAEEIRRAKKAGRRLSKRLRAFI